MSATTMAVAVSMETVKRICGSPVNRGGLPTSTMAIRAFPSHPHPLRTRLLNEAFVHKEGLSALIVSKFMCVINTSQVGARVHHNGTIGSRMQGNSGVSALCGPRPRSHNADIIQ